MRSPFLSSYPHAAPLTMITHFSCGPHQLDQVSLAPPYPTIAQEAPNAPLLTRLSSLYRFYRSVLTSGTTSTSTRLRLATAPSSHTNPPNRARRTLPSRSTISTPAISSGSLSSSLWFALSHRSSLPLLPFLSRPSILPPLSIAPSLLRPSLFPRRSLSSSPFSISPLSKSRKKLTLSSAQRRWRSRL